MVHISVKMRIKFLFFFFLLGCLFFSAKADNQRTNKTRHITEDLPLNEISRISKIAAKYASGANIPEVMVKPKRGAKMSIINNYKAAILRRQMWSEILKSMSEPLIGYNLTISNHYSNTPPPVQAFMKSESPIEVYSQCLNAFNYFYVYPNLIKCVPNPSKEVLGILFRYICMKSVNKIFHKKWIGSIFILREIIEKSMYSIRRSKAPKSILNKLMTEYKSNPYHLLVPLNNKLGKHVNVDIEGVHIWRYLVNRSRLLYSIDSPTRAPRRGEWAFVLISGSPTPREFLYMREIRFINTDSIQLITAILFTMILLKVKNPSKFKSYDIIVEDQNKTPKKTVNSNLLLSFSSRMATDYSYSNNDWNDQIDTLLDIDLEEINNDRSPTFRWNSRPLISLVFEPDITIPDQLISNCVRYCGDLVSKGVVSVINFEDETNGSGLQKKLEIICKKLQNRILPFKEIYVDMDSETPKSILKSSLNLSNLKKKSLKFNPEAQVYTYNKNGSVGDRNFLGNFPLDVSIKTSLLRQEGSTTARSEIPTENNLKKNIHLLTEDEELKLRIIDEENSSNDDLFAKTPYPNEDHENKGFKTSVQYPKDQKEEDKNNQILEEELEFHLNETKNEYNSKNLSR